MNPKLPEMAMTTLPSDPKQVIVVKRGHTGYYSHVNCDTAEEAAEFAAKYNERAGLSENVVDAMTYGSVFGWDIPLIDELLSRRMVKFFFDMLPWQHFDGVAVGTTWNGFDNVRVTPKVAAEIDAFFADLEVDEAPENRSDPIAAMTVKDGLIDLSNGFTTVIVRDGEDAQP